VINADCREPFARQAVHTFPDHAAFLAAPREASLPKPPRLHLKPLQGLDIERYALVAIVTQQNRAQPSTLVGDGLVPSALKLGFDFG
jgi:hypothetical protein